MLFLIFTTAIAALYVAFELSRMTEDRRKAVVRSWHFKVVCLTAILVIVGATVVTKTGNVVYLAGAILVYFPACHIGRKKLSQMF
jgi:uncharacterized membrane protein (DUF2068 family)